MADQRPVIEMLDVYKRFRKRSGDPVRALDGVSLSVSQGGAMAVVGESGSGKTTLARILVGLEQQDGGRVFVAGHERPQRRLSSSERNRWAKEVQMVFQNPYKSLDPRQGIGAGLEEILNRRGVGDREARSARTAELLQRVGLSGRHAAAVPRALSGGERQRVAIARALASDPAVLVLDEPVSALDVSIQAQILALLADLRQETETTLLLITHDLAVARQVADTAVVMRQGQIVERGTPAEIIDNPQHPYTQLLKASIPGPGWQPPSAVDPATNGAH